MQRAPSVVYPVGRSAFWAGVLVATGLLGSGLGLAAFFWIDPASIPLLLGEETICVVWSLWALQAWHCSPSGWLRWDAQGTQNSVTGTVGAWRWCGDLYSDGQCLKSVFCTVDFQRVLLLKIDTPSSSFWVWVDATFDEQRWRDLRRALHAKTGLAKP